MESISQGSASRLIEAMMEPDFYPDRPSRIEVKQTHMSYVFLAGEYVYKVKKPVRFNFADCSTLAMRYELCREEVRLNRRLAPEVYLGVIPIVRVGPRFLLGHESRRYDPKAQEYAVKMRRLPEDRMLDRLVRTGEPNTALIDELAKRLANFHRGASTAAGWRYGSATAVRRSVLGNLDECERFLGYTLTDRKFAAIDDYLKGFIVAHRELLNDRVRQGHVRDGHGDLRCEHICMTNGIQIFDCLEFSERLRCADVASDIAFLAMDLDSLGSSRLADEMVSAYAEETADEKFPTLINFYKCHRACVRGKVESLKSLENEVPSAEREQARDCARAHFTLAFAYASRGKPALVVVCGLSGTGKSTVSRMLQYRTGFEMLVSDRLRKRLAGVAETFDGDAPYGAGIYSAAFDRLTYDTLLARADGHLLEGRGVIIDATFKRPEDRRAALATGFQIGVPVLFVECRADHGEVLRRLRERTSKGAGPSDATEEVYLRQREEFVPIREVSARQHLVVDTTKGIEHVLPPIEDSLSHLFDD
ncbi:MAG: AAA family ATPase [Candidatus Binataceae bacterium]|jgi:aminoglycoside phosphotransferase family enzyme